MADTEFNIGEAYGELEQAQADRNFYLSMVQGGNTAASPIAAYLAGVAGVKAAAKEKQYLDAKMAKEDARYALERAQTYGEKLRNNLFQVAKSANNGEISQGSAAAMAGHLVREMGATPVSYDADNGMLTYRYKGEDYELDLKESPYSKYQRQWYEAETKRTSAEARAEKDKARAQSLLTGKPSSGNTAKETKFLSENKIWYDRAFNPKENSLYAYNSEEDNIRAIIESNPSAVENWNKGYATLDEDAKERLAGYNVAINRAASKLGTAGPVMYSEEYAPENAKASTDWGMFEKLFNSIPKK